MSAHLIKSCALAAFAAICGLSTAPAFAQNGASVVQNSNQTATQVGDGNVSVQGNVQTGIVSQGTTPGIMCFAAPCPAGVGSINGANVVQTNQQDATQIGNNNTSIQGSSSTATVLQGGGYSYPYSSYPYGYPYGINGASAVAGNQQSVTQIGSNNSATQANSATAIFRQY